MLRRLDLRLKRLHKKTKWSWERMCREMHRVNNEEGCSHTTLFRYAARKVKRYNRLTGRWIINALDKLEEENP